MHTDLLTPDQIEKHHASILQLMKDNKRKVPVLETAIDDVKKLNGGELPQKIKNLTRLSFREK